MRRLLEALARLVIVRRHLVVGLLALITLGLASQLPRLDNEPSVNSLVADFEGQQAASERFGRTFGHHQDVVLVLIHGPDVLAQGALDYQHRLALRLGALKSVARVEGITVTRLPHARHPRARASSAPSGDPLLGALARSLGSLTHPGADLSVLIPGPSRGSLEAIVRASPERFPDGLRSLEQRLARIDLRVEALVRSDRVTAEEAARIRDVVARSSLLEGQLVSADQQLALVAVTLKPVARHAELAAAVMDVERLVQQLPKPEPLKVELGGLPPLRISIVDKMQRDQLVIMPLVVLVCVLLLTLAFRWWPAIVFPLVAVGATIVQVLGLMPPLGMSLNIISNILPPLLIIIGISDAIHLVGRYREELSRGHGRLESGRITVKSMAVACLLTSLTTAVGFASLAVARTPMLREFGAIAAVGVMLAYVATVTLVPALLVSVTSPRMQGGGGTTGGLERCLSYTTRAVVRRPWPVLAVAGLIAALSLNAARRVSVDVRLMDQFDAHEPVARTTRLLESKLHGVRPLEVSLEGPAGSFTDPVLIADLTSALRWARTQPGVLATRGYTGVLRETRSVLTGETERTAPFRSAAQVQGLVAVARSDTNALAAYLSEDGTRARATVYLADVGARRSIEFIDAFERRLEQRLEAHVGLEHQLLGEAYTGSKGLDAVVKDLMGGLALAIVVIFAILTLLFRSARLGLLSIPPNLLPALGTVAYMALRGIPLTTGTAIIFAISIGLAVDGSIHVMARFREEQRHGVGRNAAIVAAARGTGRAIVVTCATLALGFSVLLASSFVTVRQFGELVAVTVVGCLVATIVVQPALLAVGVPSPLARSRRRRSLRSAPPGSMVRPERP